MNLDELNELDLSNIGSWPAGAKAILLLVLFAAILGAGWYLDWQDQFKELKQAQADEQQLRTEFETKQKKAANLASYEAQLEEMSASFDAMLRQLPNKSEVAALLVDITQTGLAAGLEFELFRPGGEIRKDFYAELPISIRVKGTYHEFGDFVSSVAGLPRIVTLHDIGIRRGGGKEGEDGLIMEATAKTYRYLDEEELNAAGGAQ